MTRLLQDWLAEQAERRPGARALVSRREALSFGALQTESDRLARLLAEAGCVLGDRVALAVPRSPRAILAIHAILKSGGIYVPIDVSSPPARVVKILESCTPRVLLASHESSTLVAGVRRLLPPEREIRVGWLEATPPGEIEDLVAFRLEDLPARSDGPPLPRANADDPAHILFTSGSTGDPKGVMVRHSSVIRFVEWAVRFFGTTSEDRMSGHPPLHFDLSTFDIFASMAAGAELHLVPLELNLLPHKMAEFIRESRLTRWFSVPSMLSFLAKYDAIRQDDFPDLRHLIWCGEVLPTPVLIHLMRRLPHATFTNLYGPTETTIASSYHTVPECPADERAPVPIGLPCDGESLLVLDDALRPVPDGETGDLYIGGVGLSPGYWGEPEKTRRAFLENPWGDDPGMRIYRTGDLARRGEDGLIYFLGRADTQIKSRGYRIELGEIESALAAVAGLRESAVVAVPSEDFGGVEICCAYVPADPGAVTPRDLRHVLAEALPTYMIPTVWRAYELLPKNASGKIDRRRLREEFESRPASD